MAPGTTRQAVQGMATKLASGDSSGCWPKVAIRIGASPRAARHWAHPQRRHKPPRPGLSTPWRDSMPKASTATAANDSHSEGPRTLKGSITITAASAAHSTTEKAVTRLRPRHHMTTASMISARCVGRAKPAMAE